MHTNYRQHDITWILYMFDLINILVPLANVISYTFTQDCDSLLQSHCLNGKRIQNFILKIYLEKQRINELQKQPQITSFFFKCTWKGFQSHMDGWSTVIFTDFLLIQDCGSRIRPEESCGLQPLSREYLSAISQAMFKTCEAGDTKGLQLILFLLKINSCASSK